MACCACNLMHVWLTFLQVARYYSIRTVKTQSITTWSKKLLGRAVN